MVVSKQQRLAERKVGERLLVFPLARSAADIGAIYTFEGTGAAIWDCLSEPRSLDDIVAELESRFEVQGETVADDVRAFVSDLREAGLVSIEEPA